MLHDKHDFCNFPIEFDPARLLIANYSEQRSVAGSEMLG